MKPTVIIPARGGSKRILRKNIIDVGTGPALGLLISNLHAMALFEKIIVSSDDEEIINVAVKYGAEYSTRSAARLSNDITQSEEVVRDCILKNNLQDLVEPIFCIYPLALLLNKANIMDALKLLSESPDDFIISGGEMDINPLRHTFKNRNQGVEVLFPEYNELRSQDLPPVYFDVGMFYLAYPKIWLQPEKFWYNNNAKFVDISKEDSIDVDTYKDLEKLITRYNFINSSGARFEVNSDLPLP
jgi:pseudaminic acid cytidylyltransferase